MMQVKRVAAMRGVSWLGEGYRLFRSNALIWIVDVILYLVLCGLLSTIPPLGALLQPPLLAGLLKGAQDVDRGRELRIEHLFDGFRERSAPLVAIGLLYLVGWFLIVVVLILALIASGVVADVSFDPSAWDDGLARFPWYEQPSALLLLILGGFALYLPLAMAVWFAPALAMLQGLGASAALWASFIGCLRNMGPFLLYGLGVLLLGLLSIATFGLGFLVLGPVVVASIYAGYKDIFTEGPAPTGLAGRGGRDEPAKFGTPDPGNVGQFTHRAQ